MKLMIWNVNGLRSCIGKGFVRWLGRTDADLVGIQEVRAMPEEVEPLLRRATGWKRIWFPAGRKGYSGVGIFTREEPRSVTRGVGRPEFDVEGRLLVAEYGTFVFLDGYFPKGSGPERDNSRVPYKLAFYEAVLGLANSWRKKGKGVIIGGDFNTAHREIDLRNWRTNRTTSGFLPEERAFVDRYLADGFHDVFRESHPDEEGHYTWWSQRQGARARNVGWRIDYFLVSGELRPRVTRAWIEPKVLGSDHCPVGIELST